MSTNTTQTKAGWGAAIAATMLVFVAAMDQVMMPIATSAIVAELKTTAGMIQTAIALVSLVAAPLYVAGGKLGDIHGKKRIFIAGLILYGIGVLGAALAPSMVVLIGGWSILRALAMVLVLPASVGLILANYEGAQRGQVFAIYGVGAVTAALVGPLLMGFSADLLSWRVPFGLEVLILVVTVFFSLKMEETDKIDGMTVDWGGVILAFFGIGSIILGSMLGGRYGWWEARRPFELGGTAINPLGLSPAPLLMIFGVIVIAFTLNRIYRMEAQGKQPLFSMKLFDNRTFSATWATSILVFVLAGSIPFIVPVFLQQAVGFNGSQSGLVMVTFAIGSIILGFASGTLIQKMQSRTLFQVFMIVMIAGIGWLYAVISLNVTVLQLALPMFVIGAGFGVVSSQIPNITLSDLSPDLTGEGSGMAETGKELGIGLGTAVIGSILFSMAMSGVVTGAAKQMNLELPAAERNAIIVSIEDNGLPEEAEQEIAKLPPEQQKGLDKVVEEAYVGAFRGTLGVLVGVLLAALLVASFIPRVKTEAVAAKETRERVADVAARRN